MKLQVVKVIASGNPMKDCREKRKQNMQQSKNWLSHIILGNYGLLELCLASTANSSGHGQYCCSEIISLQEALLPQQQLGK